MNDFATSNTYKKIEYYLYNYDFIDAKVNILKTEISDSEYHQNYAKYIKNKSSSLEDLVIRNMNIEKKILKLNNWKKLIEKILKEYEQNNQLFYNFIHFKYFLKFDSSIIEEKLNLSERERKDIQTDILQYIFSLAIKNNMLKEVRC